eukprot:1322844-Amorphochlora_amoeboformis.AAC.1
MALSLQRRERGRQNGGRSLNSTSPRLQSLIFPHGEKRETDVIERGIQREVERESERGRWRGRGRERERESERERKGARLRARLERENRTEGRIKAF